MEPDEEHKKYFHNMSPETKEALESLNKRMDVMEENHKELRQDVKEIKENHLAHLQCGQNDLKIEMTAQSTNLKWILIIGGFTIVQGAGILVAILTK